MTFLFPAAGEPPRGKLSLYAPTEEELASEAADGGLSISADLTVPEFYEAYVFPTCHFDRSGLTAKDTRCSLRYWERLSGNPRLIDLDDFHGPRFIRGLRAVVYRGQPLTDNTIRKHATNVQFVLDRAGPRTRQNPQAKNLIEHVPLLPAPGLVVNEVRDNFSLAEIGQLLTGCQWATRPRLPGVAPPDWWRAIFLFDYNIGLRFETLRILRWEWLEQDETGWWFAIPGKAVKKKHGRRLWVNAAAMAALNLVRPAGEDLVFPWPYKIGWLHRTRKAIMTRAGLPPARRLGFRGLRKAMACELARINPVAAQMALGHSGRNVMRDHYLDKSVMTEAMDKMPQPVWDRPAGETRQLSLFD